MCVQCATGAVGAAAAVGGVAGSRALLRAVAGRWLPAWVLRAGTVVLLVLGVLAAALLA